MKEHTIKVTITDFLANGGKLSENRKIYSGTQGNVVGTFGGLFENGCVKVIGANSSFQGDPDFFAVKIKTIPV